MAGHEASPSRVPAAVSRRSESARANAPAERRLWLVTGQVPPRDVGFRSALGRRRRTSLGLGSAPPLRAAAAPPRVGSSAAASCGGRSRPEPPRSGVSMARVAVAGCRCSRCGRQGRWRRRCGTPDAETWWWSSRRAWTTPDGLEALHTHRRTAGQPSSWEDAWAASDPSAWGESRTASKPWAVHSEPPRLWSCAPAPRATSTKSTENSLKFVRTPGSPPYVGGRRSVLQRLQLPNGSFVFCPLICN